MRNVYMSFLGLGSAKREGEAPGYQTTIYTLNGKKSRPTPFVQAAEMELLGGGSFNRVLIVATRKSHDAHFAVLQEEMAKHGATPIPVLLEEDFSPAGQWAWFEAIMGHFDLHDRLTVDLTHGYRVIPIIFSTAINFLIKSRDVQLSAMYYGAFEKDKGLAPIVDMKDFYVINEWAEAVSRLVEDADARKLAQVADRAAGFEIGGLGDQALLDALNELTNAVRNVEVNTVADRTDKALSLVRKMKGRATVTGKLLLELVENKFTSLSTSLPISGRYDLDYFRVQLAVACLLLEHRLYMQAYTVMREFVASLAMIARQDKRMTSGEGRKKRAFLGEIWVQMLLRPESSWTFEGDKATAAAKDLRPLYDKLDRIGVVGRIKAFMKGLTDLRNGFDHAWTSKNADFKIIERQGQEVLSSLEAVLAEIEPAWDRLVE